MSNELRCIERVSRGFRAQRGRDPVRLGPVDHGRRDGHQIGQLVVAESGELQAAMLRAFEVGERDPQLLRSMLSRFARARDEQHRCIDEPPGHMAQHQQRRRFGPLEIVQHQHERTR